MVGDVRQVGCHGVGIILAVGWGGSKPIHRCADIFWFEAGKKYMNAQSLIKVLDA